jgi:hypothetical protein
MEANKSAGRLIDVLTFIESDYTPVLARQRIHPPRAAKALGILF